MNLRTSHLVLSGLILIINLLAGAGCRTGVSPEPDRLRVLTYNIHHGEGVDGRLDLERIAALINSLQPDVVALQEVDRGATRTQSRDLPAELARLTGLTVAFGKNIDLQGGAYGNAVLSRHPIIASTNFHYRMLHAGEQRGLLVTQIDLGGTELVFMATHLDFRPDPAERLANVEELKLLLAQHPGKLAIVAGDFNDHPGGAVHQAMKAVFTDAWETAGTGDGFTFSSETPKSRIDYIYIRREVPWEVVRAEVPPSLASDHLPLWIELRRRPQ